MEPTAATRKALLESIASMLPKPLDGSCVLVAVDGVDGAGKTHFANELAHALELSGRHTVRISIDGFHNPRDVRYRRGRHSPEGFWLDSYDYDSFTREVLLPFRSGSGATFRRAVHDVTNEEVVAAPAEVVKPSSVLIVDGIFLHREELVNFWDFSVFLDVPFEVSVARMAARDGGSPKSEDQTNRRYVAGQRIYLDTCKPSARATVVVDNSDFFSPRLAAEKIGKSTRIAVCTPGVRG